MASLWVPFFVSLKHFLQCDSFCFFLGELSAPGYALVCCSALTGILELQIAGCLFALFLPVVPSLRTDLPGQVAMHEEGVAIITPWATQIDLLYIVCSRDGALVEDIAEGDMLGR